MSPIPVYLLTGFLGAGKTTLLNHLLGHFSGQRPGLIINEFGALGIDARKLRPGEHPVIELNKGSVFCICLKTDLLAALTKMAAEIRPGVVFIEATGVAEPADFEALLASPGLTGAFTMRGNLCVIDSLNFTKAAAFSQGLRHQVEFADGLILNKSDLISGSQREPLKSLLREMNPSAVQTECRFGEVDPEFVRTIMHTHRPGRLAQAPPAGLFSISLRPTDKIERSRFREIVSSLGANLLRLKGSVEFEDGPYFVESVLGEYTETPQAKPGHAGFTVIGYKLNAREIENRFESLWMA